MVLALEHVLANRLKMVLHDEVVSMDDIVLKYFHDFGVPVNLVRVLQKLTNLLVDKVLLVYQVESVVELLLISALVDKLSLL